MAVAYAIVAWVLVQVADTFFPALQLPEWTVTFVAALLILGFPVSLVLSWAYELTPEGIKRSAEVQSSGSAPDTETGSVYTFEGFQVHARRRVLSRVGGEPIPLTPKVFDTLLYFAERPGQLLGKRELMEAVWPNVVVEENNLNQVISTLRRVLGEVPGQHRFIVTEPGRGYRFVATVHMNESKTAGDLGIGGLRIQRKNLALYTATALSAVILLAGLFWYLQPNEESMLPNSVAVLPLENLSPPENAFYADGMHVEIINQLSKLRNFNVIVRESVLPYAIDRPSLSQIAAELNVESIMTGSFQYVDGQIQVTVQLVDPTTSTSLWGDDYREDFSKIFDVQADIASKVASALETELSANEQASLGTVPTSSNDAYRLYLRALGVPRSAAARRLLHEALAIDPDFGAAHARLAREYAISMIQGLGGLNDTGLEMEELDRLVREHAGQALSLDLSLTDAYLGLAWTHAFFWRWSEWLRANERLLEVSPNNVDGIRDYALASRTSGRIERALELAQRAVGLDPSAESLFALAAAHREAGNLSEAIDAYRAGIRLNPDPLARLGLGLVETLNGNSAELEDQLLAVEASVTDPNPATVALFAYAHGRLGHEDDATRLFDQLRDMSADQSIGTGSWVFAYLAIGDTESALDWMRRAAERAENHMPDEAFPQLLAIRHNSWADPVLDQPDFIEARSRITGN